MKRTNKQLQKFAQEFSGSQGIRVWDPRDDGEQLVGVIVEIRREAGPKDCDQIIVEDGNGQQWIVDIRARDLMQSYLQAKPAVGFFAGLRYTGSGVNPQGRTYRSFTAAFQPQD